MRAPIRGVICLSAAIGLVIGCGGGGVGPSSAGTFNLRTRLTATKGNQTFYTGPASFNAAGGHTVITLWRDSSFTAALVTLTREVAVTAPDSFGCANRITAENNPATAATLFITVDVFTDSTASPFGGDVTVSSLTSTTLTGTVGYSDGTHDVDGPFSAVLR